MRMARKILKYALICLMFVCLHKTGVVAHETLSKNIFIPEMATSCPEFMVYEHDSFSTPETQGRVPRQSNFRTSLRTNVQIQRQNVPNQLKKGFTLKNTCKSMNNHVASSFFISILTFPSGMNKTGNRLVGFRKFLI